MAELNLGNFSKNLQLKTDGQTDRKTTYTERASALPKNYSQTVEYYESPDQRINNYCKQLIIISDGQF